MQTKIKNDINKETLNYIKKVLSHYIAQKKSVIEKRIEVYKSLRKEFNVFGFTERFKLKKGINPGVFMFNVNNKDLNLDELKIYLWRNGIHCSVFYGERTFYIPSHQNLTDDDIKYFAFVIKNFIKKV